jgi:plastocyanin
MVPTDLRCLSLVSACATSALLFQGDKFTVVFPVAGNFKLVCLVHADMTGTNGSDTLSVMRFGEPDITVHAGDTVEWTNDDSITAHTVTFGPEPQDLVDPSSNVNIDADGARHGVLNSPSDAVHSGFIQAAPQDRRGLAQAPTGVTRFRVTFSKPGLYPYICSLHDALGMKGKVVVLP